MRYHTLVSHLSVRPPARRFICGNLQPAVPALPPASLPSAAIVPPSLNAGKLEPASYEYRHIIHASGEVLIDRQRVLLATLVIRALDGNGRLPGFRISGHNSIRVSGEDESDRG